jgi:hypothetical protein
VLYQLPLCLLPRKPFHGYGVPRDVMSLCGRNVVKRRYRHSVAGHMWEEHGRTFGTALTEWHEVAQLVEALRYKSEGRGFSSPWCQWNFSLAYSFWPHYGPGVDSPSNRNEYQEYFLGVNVGGA